MNPFDKITNNTNKEDTRNNKKQKNQDQSIKLHHKSYQKRNINNKKAKKQNKINKTKRLINQDKNKEHHNKEYSTIRIDLNLAEKLKALQSITNDHSRTRLLKRMLKIVYPVILNNKNKVKRFKKVNKSIHNINQIKKRLNL